MCLAMCLKKLGFQADCVFKLGAYKIRMYIVQPGSTIRSVNLKCFSKYLLNIIMTVARGRAK